MTQATLQLSHIEPAIRTQGEVQFEIAGRAITLNLQHRHERNYAASLLLDVTYPQGDIDLMLFQKLLRAGDSVLDAGANIGFTALKCMSMGASRVVAVEPVPDLFRRLTQVADGKVISINKALSYERGKQTLTVSQAHNQGSTLKNHIIALFPAIFGASPPSLEVETTTVDTLVEIYGAFDVWKLDIEGSEVDALRGASTTLREGAPRSIIAELFGNLPREFFHRLADIYQYRHRALIRKADYQLVFADYHADVTDAFHPMSPTFVFSKERLS